VSWELGEICEKPSKSLVFEENAGFSAFLAGGFGKMTVVSAFPRADLPKRPSF